MALDKGIACVRLLGRVWEISTDMYYIDPDDRREYEQRRSNTVMEYFMRVIGKPMDAVADTELISLRNCLHFDHEDHIGFFSLPSGTDDSEEDDLDTSKWWPLYEAQRSGSKHFKSHIISELAARFETDAGASLGLNDIGKLWIVIGTEIMIRKSLEGA